jgi:hypothetical protein
MALMATLPSGESMSSLTSSTSSAVALSEILVSAAIAISTLIFVLVIYEVMSRGGFRDTNTTAALRAIWMPLVVTFCAWLAFEVARRVVTGSP